VDRNLLDRVNGNKGLCAPKCRHCRQGASLADAQVHDVDTEVATDTVDRHAIGEAPLTQGCELRERADGVRYDDARNRVQE
jgi:hypothetical protein